MFAAKDKVFPREIHPAMHHVVEGKANDFQREDRKVKSIEMKLHSSTVEFSTADGRGMLLEDFDVKASELEEKFGKQLFRQMTSALDEAVDETGNEIKVKKGEFQQSDMLKLLEMREINFDARGNPTQQIICGHELAEEFENYEEEWAKDEEFQAQIRDIMRRKREEFNEREARRRLVD